MTDLRKAAEMALDALTVSHPMANTYNSLDKHSEAMSALRTALAQPANQSDCGHKEYRLFCQMCMATKQKPEQEPVAWYYADSDVEIHSVALSEDLDDDQKANCIPLYTAPPSKPINFLLNGTRYKVTHQRYYGCSIVGLPENLNGQWVALVDATDDKHLQHTAPPSKPWVSLTDEDIHKDEKIMIANIGYGATFETLRELVKAIEAALRSKNT